MNSAARCSSRSKFKKINTLYFRFIFKGDDDIFLNRFLLKELLDKYNYADDEDIIIGSVLRNSPRIENESSKQS